MTLGYQTIDRLSERLRPITDRIAARFPGESGKRQPVHTVYGGAHLFTAATAPKLGELALRALQTYAPDAATLRGALGMTGDTALIERVYERVVDKLAREPVEDFRLDFEDGYGNRSDEEEDGHARSAAAEVAKAATAGTAPPFIGIRVKPFSADLHRRSLRTLDLFLTTLVESSDAVPEGFVVTLPKVVDPEQVAVLDAALTELEGGLGISGVPCELMVETPQSIIGDDGLTGVRRLVDAGNGRVIAAHFGTYDFTASCSITAAYQSMTHPACDFARQVQQVSLAGSGIWLSDGATNVMPVPVHRGDDLTAEQQEQNRRMVHGAWRLHFSDVRHSLAHGYYQGWDLHPAQLPTRYAAVYSFFMESIEPAGARLQAFMDQAATATLVGEVFDDAATGQGLLNSFLRALNSGAVTEQEITDLTGLTVDELRTRSFLRILEGRRDAFG
ncbi:MAG TPA: phosphoenolpyruvate kinase [Acidimicrobiia bacterium]|nr:phosphoenolpyruvate kinase [Acidimicrobiia bacterium]